MDSQVCGRNVQNIPFIDSSFGKLEILFGAIWFGNEIQELDQSVMHSLSLQLP